MPITGVRLANKKLLHPRALVRTSYHASAGLTISLWRSH
jgi:hypothetical protein